MFWNGGKKSRKQKACEVGYVRNPKTNRCVRSENLKMNSQTGSVRVIKAKTNKKKKSLKPCPDGQERHPISNRCVDMSLTDEQREEFDKMLEIMRQPVGNKPDGIYGPCKPEPCDVNACLTSASVSMLKEELSRRGYKVTSPVVNMLVPRKKGEPRP